MVFLYVASGAALGGMARYALGGWVHGWAGDGFPWGTFVINGLGSLLIGFVIGTFESLPVAAETRAFVTVGLLGGFTTFSAFSLETVALMREGEWLRATAYSLGSVGVGIMAVLLGLGVASVIAGAGPRS